MKFTEMYTQSQDYFNNLDTSDIRVRVARTPEDQRKVNQLRAKGYGMYHASRNAKNTEDPIKPNETTFLAVDKEDNPVGTIRILDRTHGKIELDNFLDVDSLIDKRESPCAEATRFTVPKHPKGVIIKILLWQAYFQYCQRKGIRTMLISSRPIIARNYTYLLFEDIGPKGIYKHRHLKNKEHHTYKMNVEKMPVLWRQANHPLSKFMFIGNHSLRLT